MKILMAIKRLENMAGGAERVFLQVAEGLRNKGHDVTLVTFDRTNATSFYKMPEGMDWVRLGIGDSAQRAGYLETVKRIFKLQRVIKDLSPDLLIPFQHSMFVPTVMAMSGLRTPIIASEHIVPDHYRTRPLEYLLLILSGLRCDKITVLSDAIIKMYPSILRGRMVAMPNPVATSPRPADVYGDPHSSKVLISVGRLDPQKDQKTLIEAFARIHPKFPDWRLKIFGEGALRNDLEQQIANLGMTDFISLPGLSNDIMQEYQQAQAFALASTYESFGLATAEAMSAGLPVIGFADCAGTNELIRDGESGILVGIHEGETRGGALASGLSSLLASPELRQKLGDGGRRQISSLSVESVVQRWEDLIRAVTRS